MPRTKKAANRKSSNRNSPKSRSNSSPWAVVKRATNSSPEDRKEAILTAAAQLFSEKGYEGSSLDELAERLNISKPTIYYYVGNKHNCYYEISLRAQQPMLRALSEIEKMPGTALDKLTALLRRYVLEVATTDYGRCLLRIGRRVLNGEKRKEIDRNMLTADKKLMKLLKLGMKEGSITDFEPTVTFYTIFGAINWDVIWYSEKGDVTPIELADRQIQIFLHGLRPRD